MSLKEDGYDLKKKAKADGNLVSVDIDNMYYLIGTLSHFYYKKHHEWLTISFITKDFRCTKIWFNKGNNNRSVTIGLSPYKIREIAVNNNSKYIFLGHNHPGSTRKSDFDQLIKHLPKPKGASKYFKIKHTSQPILKFSNKDLSTRKKYNDILNKYDLKYGEGLFVKYSCRLWGDSDLAKNYLDLAKTKNKNNFNKEFLTVSTIIMLFVFLVIFLIIIF